MASLFSSSRACALRFFPACLPPAAAAKDHGSEPAAAALELLGAPSSPSPPPPATATDLFRLSFALPRARVSSESDSFSFSLFLAPVEFWELQRGGKGRLRHSLGGFGPGRLSVEAVCGVQYGLGFGLGFLVLGV